MNTYGNFKIGLSVITDQKQEADIRHMHLFSQFKEVKCLLKAERKNKYLASGVGEERFLEFERLGEGECLLLGDGDTALGVLDSLKDRDRDLEYRRGDLEYRRGDLEYPDSDDLEADLQI